MHRANYRVGDGNWGIWEPKINFDRRPASTGAASHYRCTVKLNAFLEQLIPNFRGTRRPRTEETRASHNGSRKTTLIATWWTTKLDYRFMVAPMHIVPSFSPRTIRERCLLAPRNVTWFDFCFLRLSKIGVRAFGLSGRKRSVQCPVSPTNSRPLFPVHDR